MHQSPQLGNIAIFASFSGNKKNQPYGTPHDILARGETAIWDYFAPTMPQHARNGFYDLLIRGPHGDCQTEDDRAAEARGERARMNFDTILLMPQDYREALFAQWDYALPRLRAQAIRPIWYMGTCGHHLERRYDDGANHPAIFRDLWRIGEWLVNTGCPVVIDWLASAHLARRDHFFHAFAQDLKRAGLSVWSEAIHSAAHPCRDLLDALDGTVAFESRWRNATPAERSHTLTRPHIRMLGRAELDLAGPAQIDERIADCIEQNAIPAIGTLSPAVLGPRTMRVARALELSADRNPTVRLWRTNHAPTTTGEANGD